MAQLQCKTLGDVSPGGKARVYFACHPKDHTGYFEEITTEILKFCDCAIYYYDEEPELDDEYFVNLYRMQLMVMPVTSRLLYMPNRAMDMEFPYAVEHHIPVLPLMQEQGLEEKYAELFGNLQFLDKWNRDITAIPYEEKLKKHLDAVLLNDEMVEKVRAAFDAWIFLSYRKKDRKAAQELMKLIHSDPRCRDIAIWYDEFLNPGEDFNDAIRKALAESQLFVLAVTPNLLEQGNYVMAEEYPEARKAGKPILPAEMERTDRDALSEGFPGIPEPLDPGADGAVTQAVLDALGSLAVRENDEDPKHNFFIGLAYLSGLFVEKDHPLAVRLITQAAEAGITEAMEKLVSMYETGEGVGRDQMTAIAWQKKLVAQAKEWYEEAELYADAEHYITQLNRLGNCWLAVLELPSAKAAFETMLSVSEKTANEYRSLEMFYHLSTSYYRMGDIEVLFGNDAGALECFRRGLGLSEQLVEMGVIAAEPNLADGFQRVSDVAWKSGDISDAQLLLRNSVKVLKRLAANGSRWAIWKLSLNQLRMGGLLMDAGAYRDAQTWLLEGLNTAKQLSEISGRVLETVTAYRRLGDLSCVGKDIDGAASYYYQALAIAERDAESQKPASMFELAMMYSRIGSLARLSGDNRSAKNWYLKSLEVSKQLICFDMKPFWVELAECYGWLGSLAFSENDWRLAWEAYQKKLEIHGRFVNDDPLKEWKELSECYRKLGDIANVLGDVESAKHWFHKDLDICMKLVEREKNRDGYDALAYSLFVVGFLEEDVHMLWEARSICCRLLASGSDSDQVVRRIRLIENTIYKILNKTNS